VLGEFLCHFFEALKHFYLALFVVVAVVIFEHGFQGLEGGGDISEGLDEQIVVLEECVHLFL
jgi:hypothetical protein